MFGQLFCINPFNDILGWRVAECFSFFFLSGFLSRTLTTRRIAGEGREPPFIPIHHLSLLPAHEHSKIYFQLCMWDDYHIFLIVWLVFTRLLLDEMYDLIKFPFDWLMMGCSFLFVCLMICYSNLSRETGGIELASTIIHVLQANQLTPLLAPWNMFNISMSWSCRKSWGIT